MLCTCMHNISWRQRSTSQVRQLSTDCSWSRCMTKPKKTTLRFIFLASKSHVSVFCTLDMHAREGGIYSSKEEKSLVFRLSHSEYCWEAWQVHHRSMCMFVCVCVCVHVCGSGVRGPVGSPADCLSPSEWLKVCEKNTSTGLKNKNDTKVEFHEEQSLTGKSLNAQRCGEEMDKREVGVSGDEEEEGEVTAFVFGIRMETEVMKWKE